MNLKGPTFVIGTGESLRGFDFSRLDNYNTVGINHIVRYYKTDVLYITDNQPPDMIEALEDYDGMLVSVNKEALPDKCNTMHLKAHGGPSNSLDKGLFYWMFSGCPALNLAILLGADPIYLLGLDHIYFGAPHFYDDKEGTQSFIYEEASKYYDYFYHDRYNMNMPEVYNCSKISTITAFPKVDIDDVLAKLDKTD